MSVKVAERNTLFGAMRRMTIVSTLEDIVSALKVPGDGT